MGILHTLAKKPSVVVYFWHGVTASQKYFTKKLVLGIMSFLDHVFSRSPKLVLSFDFPSDFMSLALSLCLYLYHWPLA
jgi:hypothetical protein